MTVMTNSNTHGNGHDVHDAHHHHEQQQAEWDLFGFWLYILSDCMIFATLFLIFGVMSGNYAQQIQPHQVFELPLVLAETLLLLVSSFTFGLIMLAMHKGNTAAMKLWMIVTFILGAGFICIELYEFHHLATVENVTPQLSGYWSIFFSLVGTHGLHVSAGLIWMIIMFIVLGKNGLTQANKNRMGMLSLFWHFLDIIWICVFSFVYLLGSLS